MATSLITEFPTFIYSSQLRDISLETDLDRLIVALVHGETEVYRTTLYAFDGVVSIYDIRNVVELYMLDKNICFTAFTFCYFDADGTALGTFNLNTVYCTHIMEVEAGIFASYNFLTTLTSKRTSPHSTEFLSVMHWQERAPMKAHCVFINGEGNSVSSVITLFDLGYDDIGVDTILIRYDDILQKLTDQGNNVEKLLAYTITWGDRVFSFYVHNIIPDVTFTFRNCFNVLETVSFSAVTTSKTKVDRSVAVARSLFSFYDQTTTKEYEVQSSALTMDEAEWIEQLFMSHCVRFGVASDAASLPITLITDSNCEISDSNADLNRVKFSWQFQDKVPHNLNARSLAPEDRIHQDQFTLQYQ
ncbi:MAG: hypothetical protein IJ328_03365 [Muribaculaceae bacterium]|nr:hypothetical protein [Muribaculaceae bacterium]